MTYSAIHDPSHIYFVTAAVIGWKQIFYDHLCARIVLDSLDWMRKEERIYHFAFVLMPSHLHTIIKPKESTIGEIVRQFGSFTAHEIVKILKAENKYDLLNFFHINRRSNRSNYSIWQDIQSQNVYTEDVLKEKLEYIHQNPINKHWGLVDRRADYIYSSACFYDWGRNPIIPVNDIREWLLLE